MTLWICATCGTQYPASETPPASCTICTDERQYIGRDGQQWTSIEMLRESGHRAVFKETEPQLMGIGIAPDFGIAQRALLTQTPAGNIMWDCIPYLDDETAEQVVRLGGIKAISISHPHYYSSMVEWAERFDATIYLHEGDRQWVMRPSERVTFWSGETLPLLDQATVVHLGGHFAGSTVLHWPAGADGKGALLTGDTIQVVADRRWVTFMYSYPNAIPLPAAEVRRIADTIAPYAFERIYGAWFHTIVARDAHAAVQRSADRYITALERPLSTTGPYSR